MGHRLLAAVVSVSALDLMLRTRACVAYTVSEVPADPALEGVEAGVAHYVVSRA